MIPSLVRRPSHDERVFAALAHGGTLFAWFLAPLVVWAYNRGGSRWVERQAYDAMIWSALGTLASIATCGLAIPVFATFHVIAAVKAYAGEPYRYPFLGSGARSRGALV